MSLLHYTGERIEYLKELTSQGWCYIGACMTKTTQSGEKQNSKQKISVLEQNLAGLALL